MSESISVPFFEIGPKAYLYGNQAVSLARAAEKASLLYRVDVVFTPQLCDIHACAQAAPGLLLCAQHMDSLRPGRGQGSVLPEAVKAAGARCVMLNHAERPLPLAEIEACIARAREVGLLSIVCASSCAEAGAVAYLSPDIVVAEPTELIGQGETGSADYLRQSTQAVRRVNPRVLVLTGAGISGPEDVRRVILSGADATGSSSAICKAANPEAMVFDMVRAVREAYDERESRA